MVAVFLSLAMMMCYLCAIITVTKVTYKKGPPVILLCNFLHHQKVFLVRRSIRIRQIARSAFSATSIIIARDKKEMENGPFYVSSSYFEFEVDISEYANIYTKSVSQSCRRCSFAWPNNGTSMRFKRGHLHSFVKRITTKKPQ